MRGRYTLEWLDSLITVSLNPEKTNLETILPEQISGLTLKIGEKIREQQSILKNEVFSIREEKKIKLLINQYHSALIILLDQAVENYNKISGNKPALKQVIHEVITWVDELLSFIEVRFRVYIKKEERVAVTHLSKTKKELNLKTEKLKGKLENIRDKKLGSILLNVLYSFCKSTGDGYPATFQEVKYINDLLNHLLTLEDHGTKHEMYTDLDKILIYLNFNSEQYIEHLIQKISGKIKSFESTNDKIDFLLFQSKEFNQLQRKAGTALYPKQTYLSEAISNWFTHEIIYFEKRLQLSVVPLQAKPGNQIQKSSVEQKKVKLFCIFSTDQMGIILRAIDELRVVKARSMNEVFKTIVPHLSTPYKEELSFDAVRSKSYAAEERDKKIVIETLVQVIEKIKRY